MVCALCRSTQHRSSQCPLLAPVIPAFRAGIISACSSNQKPWRAVALYMEWLATVDRSLLAETKPSLRELMQHFVQLEDFKGAAWVRSLLAAHGPAAHSMDPKDCAALNPAAVAAAASANCPVLSATAVAWVPQSVSNPAPAQPPPPPLPASAEKPAPMPMPVAASTAAAATSPADTLPLASTGRQHVLSEITPGIYNPQQALKHSPVTPHYSLTTSNDGSTEKLLLNVELPGVEYSKGIELSVADNRVLLHLPGRYRLDLPLGVHVEQPALKLKFVKHRSLVKAEFRVIGRVGGASQHAPCMASADDSASTDAILALLLA